MKFNVYIGYDSRQDYPPKYNKIKNPCYEVCKSSIKRKSGRANIQPIKLDELIEQGHYYREVDPLASTEFTYSRFLVPFLNDYKGMAIFCDSDFLWRCNIEELLQFYDERYAVSCVQHDYTPSSKTKMDGVKQTSYPRKNWSSLMMFNCEHKDSKKLTPKVISTETPQYLHRMEWTGDVGKIPIMYNWLEGDYPKTINPKVIHFTNGGPWHESWDGDWRQEWEEGYEYITS